MGKKIVPKRKTAHNDKYEKKVLKCLQCKKNTLNNLNHYCGSKTGIVNIGNSCYISSVFQAIAELNSFSCLNEESQLNILLAQLNSPSNHAISPNLALFEINTLWAHNNLQEDAFDFFLTILPLMEN